MRSVSGGNFTALNFPGANNTIAMGINNVGQIVGYYDDSTGTHGFLATCTDAPCDMPPITIIPPIAETPLPAALPLFATGLGALGLLAWRRKRKAEVAA